MPGDDVIVIVVFVGQPRGRRGVDPEAAGAGSPAVPEPSPGGPGDDGDDDERC